MNWSLLAEGGSQLFELGTAVWTVLYFSAALVATGVGFYLARRVMVNFLSNSGGASLAVLIGAIAFWSRRASFAAAS